MHPSAESTRITEIPKNQIKYLKTNSTWQLSFWIFFQITHFLPYLSIFFHYSSLAAAASVLPTDPHFEVPVASSTEWTAGFASVCFGYITDYPSP